jgi:hypothetical protein
MTPLKYGNLTRWFDLNILYLEKWNPNILRRQNTSLNSFRLSMTLICTHTHRRLEVLCPFSPIINVLTHRKRYFLKISSHSLKGQPLVLLRVTLTSSKGSNNVHKPCNWGLRKFRASSLRSLDRLTLSSNESARSEMISYYALST